MFADQTHTEAEMLEAITGGEVPLETVFVVDNSILSRDDQNRLIYHLIEDNALAEACRRFLQSRGAVRSREALRNPSGR